MDTPVAHWLPEVRTEAITLRNLATHRADLPPDPPGYEPANGIHHVAITVGSRDESATWYASTLGFEELFCEDADDRKACVMRFSSGAYSVGLVEHTPSEQGHFDPRRQGLDHVAFTVPSRGELEQWATELTLAGVDHSGIVEIPPGAILNFKDPNGIALALFWDHT